MVQPHGIRAVDEDHNENTIITTLSLICTQLYILYFIAISVTLSDG